MKAELIKKFLKMKQEEIEAFNYSEIFSLEGTTEFLDRIIFEYLEFAEFVATSKTDSANELGGESIDKIKQRS